MLQELLQCNIAMLLMLQELIYASRCSFCKNGTLLVRQDNKKEKECVKLCCFIASHVEKL